VATERESWSDRLGRRSTATHGRRIAVYLVFLIAFLACTIWLVADPSGATSGPRGYAAPLAPIGVLLFGMGLVRELRTGDTRDWRPLGSLRRGGSGSADR
jgi:hypothetical protein